MKKISNMNIAGIGLLSAIVIILQFLGSFIRLGPFSVSLVLIPIVVGGAMYGLSAGGFLGTVFGLTVLLSGDAAAFLAINPVGAVITVMLKGFLCGIAAPFVYGLLRKYGQTKALAAAALVCPFVNTGIFLICCRFFFMDTIRMWAQGAGFGENALAYMILGLVGGNFLFEVVVNAVLCPAVLKIIKVINKGKF